MRRSVIRIFIIASILAVFAVLSGPGSVGAATPPGTDAPAFLFGIPGDSLSELNSPTVLAHGTRTAEGSCVGNSFVVVIESSSEHIGAVSGTIDHNCSVAVDNISWNTLAAQATGGAVNPASDANTTHYVRTTKTELNDLLEIDLLVAFAELEYDDDGSTLSNGGRDYLCDVEENTGWTLTGCNVNYDTWSSSHMYNSIWTSGSHFLGDTYATARVDAWPDDSRHECAYGPTLFATHWHCRFDVN